MKKKLLFTSVVLFLLWVVGFFMMGYPSMIHTALWVAVIILIRSVIICDGGATAVRNKFIQAND